MQTADCQQLTGNRCRLPLLTAPVDCRLFLVDSASSVRHMVVDCPPTDHCSGTLWRHTHSTGSWPIQPWATARSGVSCSCLSSLQMHHLKLNEAFVEMFRWLGRATVWLGFGVLAVGTSQQVCQAVYTFALPNSKRHPLRFVNSGVL